MIKASIIIVPTLKEFAGCFLPPRRLPSIGSCGYWDADYTDWSGLFLLGVDAQDITIVDDKIQFVFQQQCGTAVIPALATS